MNADGVSYLDVSDLYLKGDFGNAINGYWSPMYSWVIAGFRALFRPSPLREYEFVHGLNFAILVFSLACFRFFLHEIMEVRLEDWPTKHLPARWRSLIFISGYAVFGWGATILVSLRVVSPDLLFCGFVLAGAGLLLRTRRGDSSLGVSVLFGATLGLGYLAKAPLFPLGFVFLAAAGVLNWRAWHGGRRFLTSLFVFLAVSSVFLIPLSLAKQRLTFGDSGKLNFGWYNNKLEFRHWQGEPPGSGTPRHPTRRLLQDPPLFEFATPLPGTYPEWDDPSYWYEGARVELDLAREIDRIRTSLKVWYGTLANPHWISLFQTERSGYVFSPIFLLLSAGWMVLGRPRSRPNRALARYWSVIVPSLAACGMFSLVYFEARHVAAFVIIFYVAVIVEAVPPNAGASKSLPATACVICLAFLATVCVQLILEKPSSSEAPAKVVASRVAELGIRSGDRLGSLDYSTRHTSWARILRVRLIAEIYRNAYENNETLFWRADPRTQEKVLAAFYRAGAVAVVSHTVPIGIDRDRWQPVPGTGLFLRFLKPRETRLLR